MHRRLNISLPEETIRLLDQIAAKGDRSHVIAEAVARYVAEIGRARLRKLLKERAVKRADLDLEIAAEWASSDRDAWESHKR